MTMRLESQTDIDGGMLKREVEEGMKPKYCQAIGEKTKTAQESAV